LRDGEVVREHLATDWDDASRRATRIVRVGATAAARAAKPRAEEKHETRDRGEPPVAFPPEIDDGAVRSRRKRDPDAPARGSVIPPARGEAGAASQRVVVRPLTTSPRGRATRGGAPRRPSIRSALGLGRLRQRKDRIVRAGATARGEGG